MRKGAACSSVALLAAVLLGLAPACRGERMDVRGAMKEEPPVVGEDRGRYEEMKDLFRLALESSAEEYLEAERGLLEMGTQALPAIREGSGGPDPMAGVLASLLDVWISEKPEEFERSLAYLDHLPQKLARTPVTAPSPSGVAAYLAKHYGPKVATLLAVRLVKSDEWPHWRVAGVLQYLEEQQLPGTVPAVIRFVGTTDNKEWRQIAVQALEATGDPDLKSKLAAERRFQQQQGGAFPPILAALEAAQSGD